MIKHLFFLTVRYPFDFIGGVYEEKEIENLATTFEKVVVIAGNASAEKISKSYYYPSNCSAYRFECATSNQSKLVAIIRLFFSSLFWEELYAILFKLKLKPNLSILKTMVVDFLKAEQLKKKILVCLKEEQLKLEEVLFYSFWNDHRALALALLKKKHKNCKVISRSHGGDVYYERHVNHYLPFKHFIFDTFDAVYPISISSSTYFLEKLGTVKTFLKAFRLGVSNPYGKQNYRVDKQLRIISCSQIVPIKRVDLLVEGLSTIEQFSFDWHHIGGDYYKESFQQFCSSKLKATNQLFKLTGELTNHEVVNYYHTNTFDVFVNVSSGEGIAVSIMEAMSFGIPVIATDVGGTAEIVIDGYNGFLLSSSPSPSEVASLLESFYKLSDHEKEKLRNNAFETWRIHFNEKVNYAAFRSEIIDEYLN